MSGITLLWAKFTALFPMYYLTPPCTSAKWERYMGPLLWHYLKEITWEVRKGILYFFILFSIHFFFIEFGGNFKYTDSLVLFVQTADSNQSMRFPENMVLFVEWYCSSHVILPLFWFFLAFKGHNCGSAACLNVPSDRWQGQMIDESSNQRLSPVDSWTTQTINSSPNGVISLSLRKFR